MPKLLITTDAQGEVIHDIVGEVVTLGRSSDNTIQIQDPSVSQHHAKLSLRGGTYVLEDLGSTNRSYHNEVPVMEKELESSCILTFGGVEAIYKVLPTDRPGATTRDGQLERQIETLRQARDLANHRNAKLTKEKEELVSARDAAFSEIEDLKKRIEELEKGSPGGGQVGAEGDPSGAVARERDALRKQVDQLREERIQLQDRHDKLGHALREAKTRVDELSAQSGKGHEEENKELQRRLEEQRDQIVSLLAEVKDLGTERDRIREEAEATQRELQSTLDASMHEREEKLSQATEELEKSREAIEKLTKGTQDLCEERDRLREDSASEMNELRNALNALTEERDAARCEVGRISSERDSMAASFEEERKNAAASGEAALAEIRGVLEGVRNEAKAMTEDRDAIRIQRDMLSDELSKSQEEGATAKNDREAALAERDKAVSELEEVLAGKDEVFGELEKVKLQIDSMQSFEGENEALTRELATLREEFESLDNYTGELLARISNGGDPNAAVDEFTGHVPSLKRFVGSNFRKAAESDALDEAIFVPDPPIKPVSEGSVVVSEKVGNWLSKKHNTTRRPAPAHSASTTAEVEQRDLGNLAKIPDLLGQMRRDLQFLIRHKNDKDVLKKVYASSHTISEITGSTQFLALHEMASALENLLRSLQQSPGRVEQCTLRTVSQSIDFLGVLMEPGNLDRTRRLEPAHILAVDDEPETLDSVLSAMEQVNLQSTGVAESAHCLDTIQKQHYDLLLLDIRLPEITGFDICSKVREMPGYLKTPVVFLTGLATMENKAQSTFRGGNDFIAKPFNVQELGIKCLIWVYRSKLELI